MNRFEILKGKPPKKSIIPDYYYGIDVGYDLPTVIAVCHKDNHGIIIFDHIESKICEDFQNIFDWYVELNGKYLITNGQLDGDMDKRHRHLQDLIQILDPYNSRCLRINRRPHQQLKSIYQAARKKDLIVMPEFIELSAVSSNVVSAVFMACNLAISSKVGTVHMTSEPQYVGEFPTRDDWRSLQALAQGINSDSLMISTLTQKDDNG